MADAPFCNIEVPRKTPRPTSPAGLQTIPPNSTTLPQAIHIINNNFNQLIKGNYVEARGERRSVITRIFDPTDSSVWVDVRQITHVLFVNHLTGQTVTWDRGDTQAPAQPSGGFSTSQSFGGG